MCAHMQQFWMLSASYRIYLRELHNQIVAELEAGDITPETILRWDYYHTIAHAHITMS